MDEKAIVFEKTKLNFPFLSRNYQITDVNSKNKRVDQKQFLNPIAQKKRAVNYTQLSLYLTISVFHSQLKKNKASPFPLQTEN